MENKPLDPDGRYPDWGLRVVDKVALQVHELIPESQVERTRDVYQFTLDDPGGLIVVVTPEALEIRLPTVGWTSGYAGPMSSSRLHKRVRFVNGAEVEVENVAKLISLARRKRQQETRPCAFCQTPTPPEHAHSVDGKWVCHGCSERHLGIVH